MRKTLLLTECGAQGSSVGCPMQVHMEGGASLSSHLGDLWNRPQMGEKE